MLKRTFLAALMLPLLTLTSAPAQAQGARQAIEGTWIFFITVDGTPPCQCIQIDTFNGDGTLEGPANDHFSGAQRGVWSKTGDDKYAVTFIQNSIDQDGAAAGIFIIKSTFTLTSSDAGTGKFTFQILANGGAVVVSGTGTFKGTKVHAQ